MIRLRPWTETDLTVILGGDSEFDDFGRPPRAEVPPSSYDAPGGLVVEFDGAAVGSVSWLWQQWGPTAPSRCPMIGVWLRPDARGRGIGSAAQRALVDALFRHTAANRVEAFTDVENLPSRRRSSGSASVARASCAVPSGAWVPTTTWPPTASCEVSGPRRLEECRRPRPTGSSRRRSDAHLRQERRMAASIVPASRSRPGWSHLSACW